jgi:alpha-galactosidase
MKKTLFILLFFWANHSAGQNYYKISDNSISLGNGIISKEIKLSRDSLFSSGLFLRSVAENYIRKSKEFSFSANDIGFDGYSGWEIIRTQPIEEVKGGKGVKVLLKSKKDKNQLEVELNYILYPDLPLIRKWIGVTNKSIADIKLESVNTEELNTRLSQTYSVVYHNYGRMKHLDRFIGDWDDPVVVVHDAQVRRGIALGNEASGVLKRTAYHTINQNVEIGLTQPGQDFPFRKWLKPGETWESPKTFICLYSGVNDGFSVIENEVNEFIVKYMKPRIIELKEKPIFVYNTWVPFRTFLNDSLIRQVAKSAAECGVQEFILDDGWQMNHRGKTSVREWGSNYGDWEVDTVKFPGGLKPTFDYIKSLGMKPGLWISIGSATKDALVFKTHPEWFIKNKYDRLGNLHLAGEQYPDFYTSCFGTEWFNYIKNIILKLVKENGLAYAKLDFSVVTSAYINDNSIAGCYATDHPLHKDQFESFGVIYQRVLKLFDELHEEAPGLFIDCTFETAGKLQLMDYAIAQHAEGNWLANFEEPSPFGPLSIRQMAWWRSPAMPAASLVIGNLRMNDPDFEFCLKSLIGTLPIVLGDPRMLSVQKRKTIKSWSEWMLEMQRKYDYMSYRKDLAGFGEPHEGSWDGWQRINFQTRAGGIFGVFRQGALENTRSVFLKDIKPDKQYMVRLAPYGEVVYKGSGEDLIKKGFSVKIENKYDGKIFEVGELNPAFDKK